MFCVGRLKTFTAGARRHREKRKPKPFATDYAERRRSKKVKTLPRIYADERGFKRGFLSLAFPIVEITLSHATTGLFLFLRSLRFLRVSRFCCGYVSSPRLRASVVIFFAHEDATTNRRGQSSGDIALTGRGDFCSRRASLLPARKFLTAASRILRCRGAGVASSSSGL